MSRDDTATSAPRFALPDQPDGITDDSRDLPDPMRAARRIRAYITGAGDGLYDTVDPGDGHRPLYGRDLESVCRALVSRTRERDAALVRAEDHRRAAHEAAGQLDRLRREVERTRHHDMYERAYFDVQSVLDNALGRDAEDGAGVVAMPNTRSPKQVHVAVNVLVLSATFWDGEQLTGDAACDPRRMPLDMSVAGDAEVWPANVRCRRQGCASRWPAYRAEVSSRD